MRQVRETGEPEGKDDAIVVMSSRHGNHGYWLPW